MIYNSIGDLDQVVRAVSKMGSLPLPALHKMVFCSFVKAGLSLYGIQRQHEMEVEELVQSIPPPYKGLVNGQLYRYALDLVRSFNTFLERAENAVLLKEANLHHIMDFLKARVGKVDTIVVLDCASIPEIITLAAKFKALNHYVTIFNETFINPIGVTRFLTQQLESFGQKDFLRQYAQLLKETLKAKFYVKSSTVDLTVHEHGFLMDEFLHALDLQKLFIQINTFAKQNSVLITSDHGYDIVADNQGLEQGLYITHGYKKKCPLNFSKIALFLTID